MTPPKQVARHRVLGAARVKHNAAARRRGPADHRGQHGRHKAKKAHYAATRSRRTHAHPQHEFKTHGKSGEEHPGKGKK
jgi:hypothetical protein